MKQRDADDTLKFLAINGRRVCYQDVGEGFPVLFGHSYLWDHAMWAPQVAQLSKMYRCIVPDLWGHGQSAALPKVPYSVEEVADDMAALLEALQIESYAVVGLSVGGMWAAHLALRDPDKVRALVLMDTFLGAEPENAKARYFAMLDLAEKSGSFPLPLIDQILPMFFSARTLRAGLPLVSAFQKTLVNLPAAAIPSIVQLGRAIFGRDSLEQQLPYIDVPTLIMVGREDLPRPVAEAERMARLIPGAQLRVIENAGHISNLEKPEVVIGHLAEFLRNAIDEGNG